MKDLENEVQDEVVDIEQQPEEKQEPDIKAIMEEAKRPQTEQKPFDPKKDKVDFSTPEQLARFKTVEAQRNAGDARNRMLMDLLEKQQERLDAIEGKFKQEETAYAEKTLLERLKSANDEGDTDAIAKAVDDLVKFRTDANKIIEKKPQKVNEKPLELDPDYQFVQELASETDDTGQPLRPWLLTEGPQTEVLVKKAEEIARDLYARNPNDPYIVAKVFKELDKEMAKQSTKQRPQTRVPDPMQGSNLTQQQGRGGIKLSDKEREIARKLGVDPKRYLERKLEMQRSGER